jgi:glutathione S-transferase
MSELQIIGFPQSTYVRVVRMAAEEKGVPYDLVPEPPHSDTVNAVHPFGKIPVMRHGDAELCESRAIAGYIDRNFDGPVLFPRDLAAEIDKWASIVNTVMDRTLIRDYLFHYLFPKGANGEPDRAAIDALLPDVDKQLGILESAIGASHHLAGDRFTFADINVLPILFYLQTTPEGGARIAGSATLTEYYNRHSERASFKNTVPPAPDA